jgi:hypothetical protein
MRTLPTLILLIFISLTSSAQTPGLSAYSYIYLEEKVIDEELPGGTLIANLSLEVARRLSTAAAAAATAWRFTRLDTSPISHHSSASLLFNLEPTSGVLTTARVLDREHMCQQGLCDVACGPDTGSAVHGGDHTCKLSFKVLALPSNYILAFDVIVRDLNDNRPCFLAANQTVRISENAPLGLRIPILAASDADSAPNSIKYYEILNEASLGNKFNLSYEPRQTKLHLVVLGELDFENRSSYELIINANDGIAVKQNKDDLLIDSCVLRLSLEIVDLNDNAPRFPRASYEFFLNEDTEPDAVVGTISAIDLDQGLNGMVKYRLVGFEEIALLEANGLINKSLRNSVSVLTYLVT